MKLVKFNEPVTFSNLLDDFFNTSFAPAYQNKKWTMPAVNIVDNDKEYDIEVAAPGKKKEDFNINLQDDILTISCSRKDEKKETEKNYSRQEFCYSSFSRSFNLTDDVDREKINAKYDNGILTLSLPKKEATVTNNVKQIDIQ